MSNTLIGGAMCRSVRIGGADTATQTSKIIYKQHITFSQSWGFLVLIGI